MFTNLTEQAGAVEVHRNLIFSRLAYVFNLQKQFMEFTNMALDFNPPSLRGCYPPL